MNQYSVKITDMALDDMESIYNYIALDLQVPDTAMGQYNRIADAIESLAYTPKHCRLFDSQPERDMGAALVQHGDVIVPEVMRRDKGLDALQDIVRTAGVLGNMSNT